MKTETKHTQGPWRVQPDSESGDHPYHQHRFIVSGGKSLTDDDWNIDPNCQIICSLRDCQNQAANAALIASAPDLLAQRDELKDALCKMTANAASMRVQRDELREALRDLITHDLMCCETDGQEPGEMCRKAQAALAKCEPQQAQAYPGGRWK